MGSYFLLWKDDVGELRMAYMTAKRFEEAREDLLLKSVMAMRPKPQWIIVAKEMLTLIPDSISFRGRPSYRDGWKYCSRCRISVKTLKNRCPICGKRLRSNPRNSKTRRKRINPEKYGIKTEEAISK